MIRTFHPERSAERWARSVETYRSAVNAFMSAVQHRRPSDPRVVALTTLDAAVPTTQDGVQRAKPPHRAAARAGELNRCPLTAREFEVAILVARGFTNHQIAETLVITPGTAANHVAAILERLDLRTRTQIAVWMLETGEKRGELAPLPTPPFCSPGFENLVADA